MKPIQLGKALLICFAVAIFAFAGCGSDDSFVTTNATQTGNIQTSFSRANVFAQTTQDAFANADKYAVSVLDSQFALVVPTTYVDADTTKDTQTIVVTGIPVGTYTVVVTAFLNGTVTGQVSQTATVNVSSTTSIGSGTTSTLVVYTGSFVPAPSTTTTTGTTSTGGTTGTTSTGGTTSTTSTGTTGSYTTSSSSSTGTTGSY